MIRPSSTKLWTRSIQTRLAVVGAAWGCLVTGGCRVAKPPLPAGAVIARADGPGPGKIRRTLIDKRPAKGLQGWETRLYLVEYGPGAAAPPHVHPAVGVGFVLDGRFESAFDGYPRVAVRAGEGFFDPADATHRVFLNPSTDEGLRFVMAYTIRVNEDMFRLVPEPAHVGSDAR